MADAEEAQELQHFRERLNQHESPYFNFILVKSVEGRRRLMALAGDNMEMIRKLDISLPWSHPLSDEVKDWLMAFISENSFVEDIKVFFHGDCEDDGTVERIVACAAINGNIDTFHLESWNAVLPRFFSSRATVRPFCRKLILEVAPGNTSTVFDGRVISQMIEHPQSCLRELFLDLYQSEFSHNLVKTFLESLVSLEKSATLETLTVDVELPSPSVYRLLAAYLPNCKSLTRLRLQSMTIQEQSVMDAISENFSLREIDISEGGPAPPSRIVALCRIVEARNQFLEARNQFMANPIDENAVEQHVCSKLLAYHETARTDLNSLSMIYVMLRKHVRLVCSFRCKNPTDGRFWWIEAKNSGIIEQYQRSLDNDMADAFAAYLADKKFRGN